MTNKHLFPEMGDFKGGFDMPPPPYSEVGQVGILLFQALVLSSFQQLKLVLEAKHLHMP